MQCVGCRDRTRIIRIVNLTKCSFFPISSSIRLNTYHHCIFFCLKGLRSSRTVTTSKKWKNIFFSCDLPSATLSSTSYILSKYLNLYSSPCIHVPSNTLILMRKCTLLSVIIPFNYETKCPMEVFQCEHTCCLLLNSHIFIAVTCFLT